MPDFSTTEYSFADIKVNLLGADLSGLRGLRYKIMQEKELVYGAGNHPKSVQRGNKRNDGELRVLKSDYDLMHDAALAAGYASITDVPAKAIVITAIYQKEADPIIRTDILYGVEFTDEEDGQNQGDKFKEISLPFIFLKRTKS